MMHPYDYSGIKIMARIENKQTEWDELLRFVQEQQDDGEEKDYRDILDGMVEAEAERRKGRAKSIDPNKCVDLTNVKSDKIREALEKTNNVSIGSFVVKLSRYEGRCFGLSLYEVVNKIHQSVHLESDTRFVSVPWNGGDTLSLDKVVEVLRWLQMITKMSIFL